MNKRKLVLDLKNRVEHDKDSFREGDALLVLASDSVAPFLSEGTGLAVGDETSLISMIVTMMESRPDIAKLLKKAVKIYKNQQKEKPADQMFEEAFESAFARSGMDPSKKEQYRHMLKHILSR